MMMWQNNNLAATLVTNEKIIMLAPRFGTAVDAQQTFSKVVTMTYEFWALMVARSAMFFASQIAIHFAKAIWLINVFSNIVHMV